MVCKVYKFIVFATLGILIFIFSANIAWAQEEFQIDYSTTYEISSSGTTEVFHQITLANQLSKVYASSYTLGIEGKLPKSVQVSQDNEALPFEIDQSGQQTNIAISFPDQLVGKGKSRVFLIRYELPGAVVQNGAVWDLTIPKLASPQSINQYSLLVRVPKEFGQPAYISPKARSTRASGNFQEFTFNKEDLTKAGIVAAFGEFQVFAFTLKYHLENPNTGTAETEIALPPDTAFQRMYYQGLEPQPANIRLDEDGNWLAVYQLSGKERLDVVAQGQVQIFAKPQEQFLNITPQTADHYLQESDYWQISNPFIQERASILTSPRDIYDFVTDHLNYNYERVQEGVDRLGAVAAF